MFLFEIFGLSLDFQPLLEEIRNWWDQGIKLIPNLLLAIIVGTLGYFITSILRKYFSRLSNRLIRDDTLAGLLTTTLTLIAGLLVLFLVLSILELDGIVKTALAGAGVVGLALGLAFQDPILNFFSGILLTIRHLFRKGDLIQVDGYFGKVQEVNLRHTSITTLQGQDVMIPNKIMAQTPITNYTKLRMRRVDIGCGVSYGDDLDKVRELTIQAIKDGVAYDKSKDIQLFFNEFGNSSINYTLRFWIDEQKTGQADFLAAQSDAIMAIKRCYDANDIMIPFPIRTLDFGIKGGEKLSEMLGGAAAGANGGEEGAEGG